MILHQKNKKKMNVLNIKHPIEWGLPFWNSCCLQRKILVQLNTPPPQLHYKYPLDVLPLCNFRDFPMYNFLTSLECILRIYKFHTLSKVLPN
jgi:hypothetical protein